MSKRLGSLAPMLTCLCMLASSARAQALDPRPEAARGNLSAELISGGLAAAAGAFMAHAALQTPERACTSAHGGFGSCVLDENAHVIGPVMTLGLLAPMLTVGAVWGTGTAHRGQGRLIPTIGGAYLLGGAGALAGVFASTLTTHDSVIDERMFLPLTAVGMMLGAVLGYRLSAPAPPARITPELSRDSVSIRVVGSL